MCLFVCLLPVHAETVEPICMKFGIEIDLDFRLLTGQDSFLAL